MALAADKDRLADPVPEVRRAAVAIAVTLVQWVQKGRQATWVLWVRKETQVQPVSISSDKLLHVTFASC